MTGNFKTCFKLMCPFTAVTATVFVFLSGCTSEKRESVELNTSVAESAMTPAVKKTTTSTVTPSKVDVATSPAAADELPGVDAEPADVCKRFLELLQSGNRLAAENLLTRTALTATSKAGLKLEPMGSANSRYQMGDTRYATIKQELAQVDCEIVDQIEGVDVRSPVTWLVRKQNLGWRITGLLVQLEPNQPLNLLSFENVQDIAEIKRRATGAMFSELENTTPEDRQAKAGLVETPDTKSLK